jgi:hypothetical protein
MFFVMEWRGIVVVDAGNGTIDMSNYFKQNTTETQAKDVQKKSLLLSVCNFFIWLYELLQC